MFARLLLCCAVLFAAGCAALPLAATRDAAVAPVGRNVESLSFTAPQISTTLKFKPTTFGGETVDYAYRTGLTTGTDRALRAGVTLGPFPNGFYGGYERGRDLRKGTRAWGTVGYVGGIGGIDGLWGLLVPTHFYAQGYAGLVAGKLRGDWRPEIGLRAAVQAGQYGYRPYGAVVLSAEPRIRAVYSDWSLAFGLGLDAGGLFCKDCAQGAEPIGKAILGLRPLVSVQVP